MSKRTQARTSVILGLLGIGLLLLALLEILPHADSLVYVTPPVVLLSIVGLVFGIQARGSGSRGPARSGIILNALGLLAALYFCAMILLFILVGG